MATDAHDKWLGEEDQILNCVDCGEEFIFTTGEQRFFKEKDYSPPKRCKNCRDTRKREREHKEVRYRGLDE